MFGPLFNGETLFGDGSYSGNIMQAGVTLQPQIYNLAGVGVLTDCIVVTGTATVAPSADTVASAVMGHNLVVIGAGASLSPSAKSKGLVLLFNAGVYLRDGGKIHIDKLGKAGNYGALSAWDLAPVALRRKISRRLHAAYAVQAEGANGGPAPTPNSNGTTGQAAGAMQTGGGGAGACTVYGASAQSGKGGKGGTCCGGGGSAGAHHGNSPAAPDYGPGGSAGCPDSAGGGAGDPVGIGVNEAYPATGGGGGLLYLFAPVVNIAAGCVVSSDGAMGGTGTGTAAGGSAGGGCIAFVTRPGGYLNNGTARAAGGPSAPDNVGGYSYDGGPGGPGSINVFQNAA